MPEASSSTAAMRVPTNLRCAINARKAAALTRVSTELAEDSEPDLAAYVIPEMGSALAGLEDACGFVGTSAPAYGGIVGLVSLLADGQHNASLETAETGHDQFSELSGDDIASLMAKLPERFWPSAAFYCSGYAAAQTFVRLGATTGGVMLAPEGARPQLVYGGVPVFLSSSLPTGSGSFAGRPMILFGSLRSAAMLGSRREMIAASSIHRFAEFDQLAVRVTARWDIACHNVGDNSTTGAMVALVGG